MQTPDEKYNYYKGYIYKASGRPESFIMHDENEYLPAIKEKAERKARQEHGAAFQYLDIWHMDPWFLEIIEYKKQNGLE